ncbi:MAG TPA: hypothetical protein PK765_02335 [bacterium]|nr:hypothetical protein [bacterium]
MDPTMFASVIEHTPLLDEDSKRYYLENFSQFSPGYQEEIILIIQQHERDLLAAIEANNLAAEQEIQERLNASMSAMREREERERAEEMAQAHALINTGI